MDLVLGVSPIVLMTLLVMEILVLLDWVTPMLGAKLVLAISAFVMVTGMALAFRPAVKKVQFQADGLISPVRFVQITDVHIGSRSAGFLQGVVNRIRALDPEFVCITGDFIDAWGVPESDLASLRTLECPIYYCTGNHERYEDFEDILARLNGLGIEVLRSRALMARPDLQVI